MTLAHSCMDGFVRCGIAHDVSLSIYTCMRVICYSIFGWVLDRSIRAYSFQVMSKLDPKFVRANKFCPNQAKYIYFSIHTRLNNGRVGRTNRGLGPMTRPDH